MQLIPPQFRSLVAFLFPLVVMPGLSFSGADTKQSTANAKLLKTAPPEMQKLAKAGNVEFIFHNSVASSLGTPGCTRYDFVVDTRYKFDFVWAWQGAQRRVTIQPTVQSVNVRVKHRVEVPEGLNDEHLWDERLVRHEFDHVTISSDPRIEPLISYLMHRLPTVVRVVDADVALNQTWCRQIIDNEVTKRREALLSLVQKNYDMLDAVSASGMKSIKDRKAFFAQMYTNKNFTEVGFPYSRAVSPLLSRKSYRNLKPTIIE